MAMFVDGPPSSIEDLNARDSDLLNVAGGENIDLTQKLQIAAADISVELEAMLASIPPTSGSFRSYHAELRHIAVTPDLKRWHTYTALRLIYQDLYYGRLNDRYRAKMKLYREEEDRSMSNLRIKGLGIVFDPLPQALPPNIALVETGDTGGTLYVAIAFVNERGEEGSASITMDAELPDGNAGHVNLTALADNAIGWNLYAGASPDKLTRQNPQTLDPMESMVLSPGRLASGAKLAGGQRANVLIPLPRKLLRG